MNSKRNVNTESLISRKIEIDILNCPKTNEATVNNCMSGLAQPAKRNGGKDDQTRNEKPLTSLPSRRSLPRKPCPQRLSADCRRLEKKSHAKFELLRNHSRNPSTEFYISKDKALDGLEGALTLTMKSKGQEIKNTTFCLRNWKRLRSLLNHSMQNSYYRRQKNRQKIQNEDIFA